MVAITEVAIMPNGGNRKDMLMSCLTIGWEGNLSSIWALEEGGGDFSFQVGELGVCVEDTKSSSMERT